MKKFILASLVLIIAFSATAQSYGHAGITVPIYGRVKLMDSTRFTNVPVGTSFMPIMVWDSVSKTMKRVAQNSIVGSIPDSVSLKKILSSGSNPTIAAGTGAGASPTISVSGNDLTGTITLTAGSSPGTLTTLATITYNVPYGTKPHAFLVPTSLQAEQVANTVYIDDASSTATAFVIKVAGGSLTNGNSYTWYYHIIQ